MVPVGALADAAGTVSQLAGVLTAQKVSGNVKILGVRSGIETGDLLSTSANTYARIKFSDGGELTLRPNTRIRIDDYRFDQAKPQEDNAFFSLIKGGLRAVTGLVGKRNGLSSYRMATPTATIGIRGTHYGVLYCRQDDSECDDYRTNRGESPLDGLHLDVVDGRIIVNNAAGSQELAAGQYGFVGINQAPVIVPETTGVPISIENKVNTPAENVLGTQPNQQDFECTVGS